MRRALASIARYSSIWIYLFRFFFLLSSSLSLPRWLINLSSMNTLSVALASVDTCGADWRPTGARNKSTNQRRHTPHPLRDISVDQGWPAGRTRVRTPSTTSGPRATFGRVRPAGQIRPIFLYAPAARGPTVLIDLLLLHLLLISVQFWGMEQRAIFRAIAPSFVKRFWLERRRRRRRWRRSCWILMCCYLRWWKEQPIYL